VLLGLSGLLAVFAIVTALVDLVWLLQPDDGTASGVFAGSIIGVVVRTALTGLMVAALYVWGRALLDPARYSAAALDAEQLRAIYESEKLASRKPDSGKTDASYAAKSDSDLVRIYEAIDRHRAADRFESLLATIKERVESRVSLATGAE
jgi:hypothetical protein